MGESKLPEAKAKAIKPLADKMVTLGKRGDLHRSATGSCIPYTTRGS